ncbi:hypothetical protein KBB59_02305 [Candidatus Woesebacteria bacterium]|jgi:hypothetical protein|nr:hypothetical protein [Candidatus Woesebacteria bacterium]HNV45199.1 hypothetical protein [Candidatus Woesebacteria bacterium]HOA11783.1 hypothetical protein [Candidatus Woesebacteria bacterium]HOC07237.1 hypothetical protein [Candidatus Woesebacteria bacterium]HOI05134.1 hypothetical protein [Candidatus Woesebacteria bacterium]
MIEVRKIDIDENPKITDNLNPPNIIIENLDAEPKNQSHQQDKQPMNKAQKKKFIIFAVIAVLAGTLTGYGTSRLSKRNDLTKGNVAQVAGEVNNIKPGDIFGISDRDTFSDSAQGYLEKGGVDGEGSHHLLREGGQSQTVALTSSVTDLDDFVGMEVKVWGETNKAQQSGWFMDVGQVEVISIDAEPPSQTLD